jgi:hypothetical protein
MEPVISWLLQGPPWVQYRTRLDLLNESEDDALVRATRKAMLAHPQVRGLLSELAEWPGRVLSNHKEAGHPLHLLSFGAELGLRVGDAPVDKLVKRIMKQQEPDGPFRVMVNVPTHFGGTGQDEWGWALCDAPLVVYALVKFGLGDDQRVQTAIQYLANLIRDNGWPCAVSAELGKFRGPGRKADPCPYANLVMLKSLSQLAEWRDSAASHTGAETLLSLWSHSREQHPYLFYMGTDFAKLKAPLVWYDVLNVLDTLTQFRWLRGDPRLQSMIDGVVAKADEQQRYTPESIWKAWADWDFGQKRAPSHWLTLLTLRMLKRAEMM